MVNMRHLEKTTWCTVLSLAAVAFSAPGGVPPPPPNGCVVPPALMDRGSSHRELLAPPANGSAHGEWIFMMLAWRAACQAAVGFNGSAYEVPRLKWTSNSWIQPQMHPYVVSYVVA